MKKTLTNLYYLPFSFLMLFAFLFRMLFSNKKKKQHVSDTDAPPRRSSKPVMLYVINNTKDKKKAIVFGNDRFLLEKNHGSDEGVQVVPSSSTINYTEILQGIAHEPQEYCLIRFRSHNHEQLKQIVEVCHKHMSGQMLTHPLILETYFIPAKELLKNTGLTVEQFTEKFGYAPDKQTLVDVPYRIEIGGNTYFELEILPETTLYITLFPAEKLDIRQGMRDSTGKMISGSPPLHPIVKKSLLFRIIREVISIACWVGGLAYIYFNYFTN